MNLRRQAGTTTVEFAIVGMLALTLLFAIMEFGRILFTLNILDESARRAARVAAVCAIGDGAITAAATFVTLPNLAPSNVMTQYLDENGTALGNPAVDDYPSIRYVRVRMVNYEFPIAIPFAAAIFDAPEISATLPRESLGVPKFGDPPAC